MAIWLTLLTVKLPFTQMKHHSIIWKHQFEDDIIHAHFNQLVRRIISVD